jgi:hypothetical protein
MSLFSKWKHARTVCIGLMSGAMVLGSLAATARTIHFDDFEDHRAPRTGDGFKWRASSRNVYTTSDRITGAVPTPLNGRTALAFSHRAKPYGQDSTAEQRFFLGGTYPEIWFRYFVRIPDNFVHRTDSKGPANNKWLCLWTDRPASGRTGFNMCWQYLPSRTNPGGADMVWNYNHFSEDGQYYRSSESDRKNFFTKEMRGRWIEVIHHVQLPTRQGANNGAIQMWVRAPGQGRYTVVHDRRDLPLRWGESQRGLSGGYLMGWANSGFSEATTFTIDDFHVLSNRPSVLR